MKSMLCSSYGHSLLHCQSPGDNYSMNCGDWCKRHKFFLKTLAADFLTTGSWIDIKGLSVSPVCAKS